MQQLFSSKVTFVTVLELAKQWQTTPGKIRQLIEDHQLAGVRIDGVVKVPAEFAGERGPLSSLRGTLVALADAGLSNDEAVAWLLTANDELGARPIEVLRAGHKRAVRRATQALAF